MNLFFLHINEKVQGYWIIIADITMAKGEHMNKYG